MGYDGAERAVRRRRRRQQGGKFWLRVRNALVVAGAVSVAGLLGTVASFGYSYNRLSSELPELDDYRSTELAQTSVVYDREGEAVDELYGLQNRYVVDRGEVSPYLRDAVVSIEDNRFYTHDGLDFEAIGRAAVSNVRNLSVQEGGSTITQQLIKNTYIDQELRAVPSVQRKVNEAALAWQYEQENPKPEILNQYLNTVYFGANAYGAEAASRTYFDKSADELELEEAAMLAGIINLPGSYGYDPFSYPRSAEARRDVVLDQMLAQGRIDREEHREAVSAEISVKRGQIEDREEDDYFLNAVRQEVIREFGEQTLYEGGLEIQTTLDPDLQREADESVEEVVSPPEGDPSASLVSIDPSTGAVRAMVGGTDFDDIQFNLATQAQRQPGSTFKTFVLAEAIRQGISPDTVYESQFLQIPVSEDSDEVYEVDNYDSIERGQIDLRQAIAASDNTVFVQLGLELGMQGVVDLANAMGIEAELEPFASTAIGGLGEGVSPLEMASAYSTLANEGVHNESYLVEEVTRSSESENVTVEEHETEDERVLSRDEAAVVTQELRGVVEEGTASYYRDLPDEIGRESAGKTGTTDAFIDAWYVGYVPQLTTSVWVGYPNERRSMVNIRGYEEINGENFPLDIWSAYMQRVADRYPEEPLPEPSEGFEDGLDEDRIGIPPGEREPTEEELEERRAEREAEEESENEPPGGDSANPSPADASSAQSPQSDGSGTSDDTATPRQTGPRSQGTEIPGVSPSDSPGPTPGQSAEAAAQPGASQPARARPEDSQPVSP